MSRRKNVPVKSPHFNLVGMFLILNSVDHEHYRTGQIIGAVAPAPLQVWVVGMERRQPGQDLEGSLPGGPRFVHPPVILRLPPQAPASIRQTFS